MSYSYNPDPTTTTTTEAPTTTTTTEAPTTTTTTTTTAAPVVTTTTPAPEVVITPFDVNGYYPLYTSESDALTNPEGDGTTHSHLLNGVTYYMPGGLGDGQYHGNYGETGSNLNKFEKYIQAVRQQNKVNNVFRDPSVEEYDDDKRYNFIIGYYEESLENVSEAVKSNPNLKLKFTLKNIKVLIVEGKAQNFLSLVRQRSTDIEYIEIDLGKKDVNNAKIKYNNKNYSFKEQGRITNEKNREESVLNRGVVSAINASQTPTGILEPPRNFSDSNVVNCGQHLEKAVVKVKKASKTIGGTEKPLTADVVVWEVRSGVAERNITYTDPKITFDPAADGNGYRCIKYYDWWQHIPEINISYEPRSWQDPLGGPSEMHPTQVVANVCHPQFGFGVGKTVYLIGRDAKPMEKVVPEGGNPDEVETTYQDNSSFLICLDAIKEFHKQKFIKNENPPGTIVNMSFGAQPEPIPNDPYKVAQSYYERTNGELNNQLYIVYYKNGQRLTHFLQGSDNEQQRAETARIVKGLGINSNNSLDNCSFRFYDRSIPAPPEFTPAFELAQNRTIREACRPRQLSNGKVIPGIQFVTAGGNNGSGFYNYNPGDPSHDERSKTYYVYDKATMDQPMQKLFTCVRQAVTFLPPEDVRINGVEYKSQKLIVVGGHDYKDTWYSNDSQKRNVIHAKGNWGSCVDFKAQYRHDHYNSGLDNKIRPTQGTSFSCPLFVGLAASLTKSASVSSMENILDQCVRKLSFEDAWDTTSNEGKESSPEWNTYVYPNGSLPYHKQFKPYILQVPKNRVKKYQLKTQWVNSLCGQEQKLFPPPKNARMNLDEDNTNLSYPDFLSRKQKQFNGMKRKRHGNLRRTSNRRGFDN